MMNFKYARMGDHEHVLKILRSIRVHSGDSVIDVGASDNPWTAGFLTATFDLRKPNLTSILHFQGNLNTTWGWEQIRRYVAMHDKFAYSVCSHTLEDIAFPVLALEWLPEISKAGFISMPSHLQELRRNIEGPWRGYIHHRWIYRERNGKLLVIPKISALEYMNELQGSDNPDTTELQIFWDQSIEYEILNDDYLGPNVHCVQEMYREALR